jgi:hypothetical protein
MKNKITMPIIALCLIATPAMAEKIVTKTYTQAQKLENVNQINFSVFDTNKDGIYSMHEVGDRLFESFDRNSDKLIDNTEWNDKVVMTIIPMEQETFKFIDYDDDGWSEKSTYTYSTFYQASGLSRFDKNADGLSAKEFIGYSMQRLDDNDDNLIDLDEWNDAYKYSRPKQDQPENYND